MTIELTPIGRVAATRAGWIALRLEAQGICCGIKSS